MGDFLSRKIVDLTGYAAGRPLNVLPLNIQRKIWEVASKISRIANILHTPLVNAGVSERAYSIFVAPVLEETVYRLILQGGSSKALQAAGLDAKLAKVIAIGVTTILFEMAHYPDVRSQQFSNIALQSLAFSITQELRGISDAIIAHGVNNGIINYL
ncbi:MAG: CPBP family intramembrane metalloprotease [Candidatus Neptunochlamydia sp.]|nr:CPBP family intramembrane metalloprotease [Candidatus Neptunochlamydia sp.]